MVGVGNALIPTPRRSKMDTATLRHALEETHQESRALIAGLSDADLDRPTANPKWRVRQLAAHIAEDDGGTVYVGKLLARGKDAKAPDFVINLANWWGLRKYRRATVAGLLKVKDERHGRLLTWFDTLTPAQLSNRGEISQMGTMTLAEFLTANSAHSRDHGDEIRAALRRPTAGAAQAGLPDPATTNSS
jgi:hypothetical protein